jgi:hypothetical protein
MNLYFSIEYINKEEWPVHSDGCSKEIDRKFCHSLLDEYLDNFQHQEAGKESSVMFKVCESHSHKMEKDNIQECDY